jgi:hypothetical protein
MQEILGAMYDIGADDYDEVDALLGYDDDYEEIMGAPFGRMLMNRGRKSKSRKQPRRGGITGRRGQARPPVGAFVREVTPTKSRQYPLGLNSAAAIAAGASLTISSQPQETFRPERYAVASSIAASFVVNDIKIGKNSQFLTFDVVPAEVFSNLAVGVDMKLDTANLGNLISVTVTNISAAASFFYSSLIGTVIE